MVGTFSAREFWPQPAFVYELYKNQLKRFMPGLKSCLDPVSSADNSFVSYVLLSGTIEKSINATFTDIDLVMLDSCQYRTTSSTMRTLRKNFGECDYVIGTYTVYGMTEDRLAHQESEWKVDRLIQEGINYMITDDPARLARKLGRHRHSRPHYRRHHHHHHHDSDEEDSHGEHEQEAVVEDEELEYEHA